jgi:2-polyprenyl-6-methoxyphenol hydroxylase-like FAD-dependent oxidoreductase
MKTTRPILIIGGGIGGLTAALALRRAGFVVEVYERAPELREVGAAIGLMANATRVLGRLGVLDALVACGAVIRTAAFLRWDGAVLRAVTELKTDSPGICLHRADLQGTLQSALPAETVRLGHDLVEFREEHNGAIARFSNGHEARGSLLIGADGLNSRVRVQLLGDRPPVYRGYQCWRGVNPTLRVTQVSESFGRGSRIGIVPMGARGTAWWATANEPNPCDDEPEGTRAKLARLFAHWHAPIPDLIAGMPDGAFFKNAIYDRDPVAGWHRGRVLLIGDAAHPTTPNLGQGGGMAIEDAYLLARCLAHFQQHDEAFTRFEELRRDRTERIVRQSRNWGACGQWENRFACALRDTLLRHLPEKLMAGGLLELMNYDPEAVEL